jgi:hypothetical protein
LSSRLKWIIEALAVVTLSVAVLAVLPGTAEAAQNVAAAPREEPATTSPAQTVVVESGDSLWSISQRLLPENATSQQIYNEVVRIYALNNERIGEDPNLLYPGEVLAVAPKVAPVHRTVASHAGSGRSARDAGSVPSERTPSKAVTAEAARNTVQRNTSELSHASRVAARKLSGARSQHPLPELDRAPLPEPVAELSPEAASKDVHWLPWRRLLAAAMAGTLIGGGAIGLILTAAFLVAWKLPTKPVTTRQKHEQGKIPSTRGRPHQEELSQPLRRLPRTPKPRAKKGGGSL